MHILTVLPRFGHKGQFVKYPTDWDKRIYHTGKRRFDTNCDLIIGMCACGERHTTEETWIGDMLDQYGCRIETMNEWLTRLRAKTAAV